MAKIALPAPRPYWQDPSEPAPSFRSWFSGFDNWLALSADALPDGQELTDVRKNRYLYQLLGEEGRRQFSTQPIVDQIALPATTYAVFSAAVRDYFQKPVGIVKARHDFHAHKQNAHETISDYLTELRGLVVDCRYGAQENEQLATQIAIGCYNPDAQKQLLQRRELNLDEFVTLVQSVESATSDLSELSSSGAKVGATKTSGSSKPFQKFGAHR